MNGSRERRLFGGHVFSPRSLLICAIVFALPFVFAHALGWRQHTGVLLAAEAATTSVEITRAVMGLIYVGLYLIFVLVAPVFALGSVIAWRLLAREAGRTSTPEQAGEAQTGIISPETEG